MRRNPLLFVVLFLIVLGALFFRYLTPAQTRRITSVAERLQDKASEMVADATTNQPAEESNEVEITTTTEKRIIPVKVHEGSEEEVAEDETDISAVIEKRQDRAAAIESEAENAMKRANELLAQAMKSADEAKEQIRIAQAQLDGMRARPNLSLIQKAPAKAKSEKPQAVSEETNAPAQPKRIEPTGPVSETERILAESVIRFDWTRSILNDDAQAKLDTVLDLLKKNPDLSIRIIGHTDSNGSENLNSWLGLVRARRVRQQLVAKGADPKRLSVSSRGSLDPVDTNETPMGRFKNRRVEFAVSEK